MVQIPHVIVSKRLFFTCNLANILFAVQSSTCLMAWLLVQYPLVPLNSNMWTEDDCESVVLSAVPKMARSASSSKTLHSLLTLFHPICQPQPVYIDWKTGFIYPIHFTLVWEASSYWDLPIEVYLMNFD